ncbi:MAG: hypothetical protein VXY56_00805 [Pseudomonadota bacterium]|nr:hypothetical protein [Pseudomonadota bacterium]
MSCDDILTNKKKYSEIAKNELKMNPDYTDKLLSDTILNLVDQINLKKQLTIAQSKASEQKPKL